MSHPDDASQFSADALRKHRREKNLTALIGGILALVCVGGYLIWWFFLPHLTPELGVVKRGTSTSVVYGNLLVEPVTQTLIRPQSSGMVSAVKVKKGDIVKEGDVLAEVTDPEAGQMLEQAQSLLKNAQDASALGSPSKTTLDAKLKSLDQLKKLLDEGNISKVEFDNAEVEVKTLQEKMQSEQLVIDAAVQAAQQKVKAVEEQISEKYVKAPQDGEIQDFYSQLGQMISKGEQMFLIGSQAIQIDAKVNEEDVGLLKIGMPAKIRLFSFPNKEFTGKIKQILPGAKDQQYSVLLALDEPNPGILNGMTGELNIITGRRENTLIIPTRSIRSGVSPTVFVVKDGIIETREIQTGFRSIESAEITSGLSEGDLIILSDQDLYKPGMRVNVELPKP